MKEILFICPYPVGRAPSQRFRFEQYLNQLQEKGFRTIIKPFFDEAGYLAVYQSGKLSSKIRAIIESYGRRLSLLLHARNSDYVFIHREAALAGPPVVEWYLARILGKRIIYDFDDAIWLTDRTEESALMKFLRWRSKVGAICKWSYRISCGNDYLATFARQYNPNVVVSPTTIDTRHMHVPGTSSKKENNRVVIGWTGSQTTLKYLEAVVPVLQTLEEKYPQIETLVIADRNPQLPLKRFRFQPWQKDSEVADLQQVDIGIMPLPDDPWTRGKCGFKALQYMALEIPAVVSPVGVNREIVQPNLNGYWCTSHEEWLRSLEDLIVDAGKRARLGRNGRELVNSRYSVVANSATFLSLFQ